MNTVPQNPQPEILFNKNYLLIILTNGLLFFGFQFYPSALPGYLKSLGADDFLLGVLTALTTLPAIITRPIAGYLLDTIGRFKILFLGLFSMTIVALIMGFFPTIIMILIMRTLHGVFWGFAATGTATVATDFIPKNRMGEGIGYFSLSCSLALAIAPALALSLPYDWMFILGTVFFALAILVSLPIKYKQLTDKPKQRVFIEKRSLLPSIIVLVSNASYGAQVTFIALFAKERGLEHVGLFFIFFALALMISRPAIGKLVDKIGAKKVIAPSLIALSLSLVLLSQAYGMALVLISGALYGLSQGAVLSSCQTLAVLRASPERLGAANATFSTFFDLGLGLGALVFGVIASLSDYGTMFLCTALCQVISLIILKFDKE